MRQLFILVISLSFSCAQRQDRIVIPTLTDNFYSQALLRIDDDLESDTENLHLVEQKMYYCEYLNWPETCLGALDEFKRQKGMTPQLLDQYITYFRNHDMHQQLLNVINRWSGAFDLEKKYTAAKVIALIKLGRNAEATSLLRRYLKNNQTADDLDFASQQYLAVGDTLMASFQLGKLLKVDANNELIFKSYAEILLKLGYQETAFQLLERYANQRPEDFQIHSKLSTYYEEAGMLQKSQEKLKSFTEYDTVIYRLADLYIAQQFWDSAHYYVDQLIDRDSLNSSAWYKKATMYEGRGWLSSSLNYYDHVLYLQPGDTIAKQRAQSVRRKIAYLQRLKFEEKQLPLPTIESKKITDNE